jgi:hypothetical protein
VTTHNVVESSALTPLDTLKFCLEVFDHFLNARAARECLRRRDCRGGVYEYADQTRAILFGK